MKNLVQVMGPGCGNREVEHCPPTYHFELSADEMAKTIADPSLVGRELGLEINSVHVSAAREVLNADPGQTVYCCVNCLTSSLCCQVWPAGSIP